jgi:hypothetical protein
MKTRCQVFNRDGKQCARNVVDGSGMCHIHAATMKGKSISPIIQTDIDELSILKRLTRDADPRVRLRAVEALLKERDRQGCEACAAREARSADLDFVVTHATEDQKSALRELIKQINALKASILGVEATPESSPAPTFAARDVVFDVALTEAPPPSTEVEIDGVVYVDGVEA